MNTRGHNERSYRLDELASAAREGLKRVDAGEYEALLGWIDYGVALNEGRALFPGDREFGEWVAQSQLGIAADGTPIKLDDRAAAMWAAANADQLAEAQEASKARTVRGLHAKWKEIEAERQRAEIEARRKAQAVAEKNTAPPAAEASSDEGGVSLTTPPQDGGGDLGAAPVEDAAPTVSPIGGDADRREGGAATPPPADPYGYADLTDEALLDLANGLRADLDEAKAGRKKAEREAEQLRRQVSELTDATDSATVIRNQAKEIKRLNEKVWKANEDARKAIAARRRAEDRVKALENAGVQI